MPLLLEPNCQRCLASEPRHVAMGLGHQPQTAGIPFNPGRGVARDGTHEEDSLVAVPKKSVASLQLTASLAPSLASSEDYATCCCLSKGSGKVSQFSLSGGRSAPLSRCVPANRSCLGQLTSAQILRPLEPDARGPLGFSGRDLRKAQLWAAKRL